MIWGPRCDDVTYTTTVTTHSWDIPSITLIIISNHNWNCSRKVSFSHTGRNIVYRFFEVSQDDRSPLDMEHCAIQEKRLRNMVFQIKFFHIAPLVPSLRHWKVSNASNVTFCGALPAPRYWMWRMTSKRVWCWKDTDVGGWTWFKTCLPHRISAHCHFIGNHSINKYIYK